MPLGPSSSPCSVREPLLFVLHVGYAWVALGLVLLGLNGLFAWAPPAAPIHALTVGAIGTMTLAVMTRATLGHSGRPLLAGRSEVASYLLVMAAAVVRVFGAWLAPAWYIESVVAAAVLWSAGFAVYAVRYFPILALRSIDRP
jgi:uncharacterized protein involved in response to NO